MDDYESLKSKWRFLMYELNPALPHIESTFQRVDSLIEDITGILGLSRNSKESLDELKRVASNITYEKLDEVNEKFNIFKIYWANLKIAFDQRTTSIEVPQLISGLPRVSDRIVGREMFYAAADNVTRAYVGCLNMPEHLRWDGFVTFAPPVRENIFEIFMPIPLNLFHLCISDEIKHYLGAYMLIAHEVAHTVMTEELSIKILSEIVKSEIRKWDEEGLFMQKCLNCPLNPYMRAHSTLVMANQLFTDIVALKISGPNFVHALIDHALLPRFEKEIVVRIVGLLTYMYRANLYADYIEGLWHRLRQYLVEKMVISELNIYPRQCVRCWLIIGSIWSSAFYRFDQLENFIQHVIKRGKEFDIDLARENQVKNFLNSGIIATNVDPRRILHCIYETFREGRNVNFSSVIHNLAYSSYRP